MNQDIGPAIAVCAILALAAWGFYLFFRRFQVVKQLQSQRIESFNRLIEKFGNAKEFIQFAESPQGKKILEEPVSPRPNPLNKVLRYIQAGVLFIMVGGGLWLNGMRLSRETDINNLRQGMESYNMASLALFLGVGLLIVAGISYVFVRRWHLANGETKQ